MATIKIELTEDKINLIKNIHFVEKPDLDDTSKETPNFGIDFYSLYGGSYVLEDVSYILGLYDKHIEGTEESVTGVRFPEEIEKYMYDIHDYIVDNIDCIEEIVHQFITEGGVKPGIYSAKENEHIWKYKPFTTKSK